MFRPESSLPIYSGDELYIPPKVSLLSEPKQTQPAHHCYSTQILPNPETSPQPVVLVPLNSNITQLSNLPQELINTMCLFERYIYLCGYTFLNVIESNDWNEPSPCSYLEEGRNGKLLSCNYGRVVQTIRLRQFCKEKMVVRGVDIWLDCAECRELRISREEWERRNRRRGGR